MPALSVNDSRRLWREARSFEDLCALGARFLEREITFFPGWQAPDLDRETDAIAARLARLCRGGCLTLASQPGRAAHAAHDGATCIQRAFVAAFAAPALGARLARAAETSAMTIRVFARRDSSRLGSPVALRGGVPYLFAGHDATVAELGCFEDHLSPSGYAALEACMYVSAFDPEWGRTEALWDELERCFSSADG